MPNGTAQPETFARAFGDALEAFLQNRGISQARASEQLGISKKQGISRLGTYLHDTKGGKRATPSAEMLYLICSKLDFEFEYNGYRISAATLEGNGAKAAPKQYQQLSLPFSRQFNLSEHVGTVSVSVKRPAGRFEVSISLEAAS